MRKVNFNNLDNIEIPDAWVEKALNLPSKLPDKKSAFIIPAFNRKLAFIACFVAVCALSITLFIFAQRSDILPVQRTDVSVTEDATNKRIETLYNGTDNPNGISQKPTSAKNDNGIEPTEEDVTVNSSTEPPTTSTATQKATTAPSIKPTQKPTQPQTTEPTVSVTESDGFEVDQAGLCVGYIPESLLCGSTTVYCFVEPEREGTMGGEIEPTKYPADVNSTGNGYVRISFNGNNSADVIVSDYYNFYFLNINGELIYLDTVYVEVN